MSISKPFLTLTTLAVAGMFGGGAYIVMNLGSIAQQVTERVASDTLGVDVDISNMNISLQERKAVVSGITIANPPGFKKPYAMTVDVVSVDLGNITKELITFEDITVRGTNVNVEVKENTTNLQTLKKNIKTKPKADGEADEAEKLKVIIDRLEMSDAKVSPSVTLIGEQDLSSVMVSDIVLTGIGKRQNGVLVRDAIAQVSNQLLKKFSSAAGGAGFYQGMSADALKEMGVNQINQLTDQIGSKIKGLFGD